MSSARCRTGGGGTGGGPRSGCGTGRGGGGGRGGEGRGEIVLVVEGAARGVSSVPGVRVESAPGSGDDHMVELVAEAGRERPVLVVTADLELRRRVGELGAEVAGPRTVRP